MSFEFMPSVCRIQTVLVFTLEIMHQYFIWSHESDERVHFKSFRRQKFYNKVNFWWPVWIEDFFKSYFPIWITFFYKNSDSKRKLSIEFFDLRQLDRSVAPLCFDLFNPLEEIFSARWRTLKCRYSLCEGHRAFLNDIVWIVILSAFQKFFDINNQSHFFPRGRRTKSIEAWWDQI